MKIADWMAHSGVAFGTSGARGLVSAMTDSLCFAYTVGYLQYLATLNEFSVGTPVAIAGDLRPSTPRILRACAAAITWMHGKPVFCGFVPTPALSLHAFTRGIPSLMVTGSHIPADRNGIKFNRAQGEFLKSDEIPMRAQDVTLPEDWFDATGNLKHDIALPPLTDVLPDYVARYRDFFGSDALSGFTVGVYQHSAVGRDILGTIIEALGGKALPLARSADFVSVDTEAVRPEDIALAREWAATKTFDAIVTTDGDSDRPLIADRYGDWMRGDVLGILTAQYLDAAAVATPVNSNTGLEEAAFAKTINRTAIGSPFVIAEMMQAAKNGFAPSVGYEANGGFLLATNAEKNGRTLKPLPTRDAVLPILCALVAAKEYDNDLALLLATLPARFTRSDRLAEIPTAQSRAKIDTLRENIIPELQELGFLEACGTLKHIDQTDGLRMTFESGDIIHLRPSGNAPELRVYVEADTPERADTLLALGMSRVAKWRA